MKVILSSIDALLNKLPNSLKQLCSQFMQDAPLEFDANFEVNELDNYGFNYLYIQEDEFRLELQSSVGHLTICIEELNDKEFAEAAKKSKYGEDYIDLAIYGYGDEFREAKDKLRGYYREHNNWHNDFKDVVNKIAEYYTIDKSNYDIICLDCSHWIYETLGGK